MTDIKWGPAIAVDGKRPGWLCNGEWRRVRSLAVGEWQTADVESPGDTIPDMDEWNWDHITAIRLPADHPHYRQTEAAVPTPQADTKPDLMAELDYAGEPMQPGERRDPPEILYDLSVRMMKLVLEVARMPMGHSGYASLRNEAGEEARAIAALLAAEPVDPLEEAKTTLDVFLAAYDAMPDSTLVERGVDDDLLTYGHLRTILRALAGEKEA